MNITKHKLQKIIKEELDIMSALGTDENTRKTVQHIEAAARIEAAIDLLSKLNDPEMAIVLRKLEDVRGDLIGI